MDEIARMMRNLPKTDSAKKSENFSPKNFAEYVGQNKAKEIARIIIAAAKSEERNIPSILIDGEYGLGKTTLAKIIMLEFGQYPYMMSAESVNKSGLPYNRKVVILDEIHNLGSLQQDQLNTDIDAGRVSIIGCTTTPGGLSPAFKSRLAALHLERYTEDDLTTILYEYSGRRGISIDRELVTKIAKRSRYNPRVGLKYLSFVYDYMVSLGEHIIDEKIMTDGLLKLGVDDKGLLERDYRYLLALSDQPVGMSYIASRLGMDAKTIEVEIEPYLLQLGLIDRTPRGRVLVSENIKKEFVKGT